MSAGSNTAPSKKRSGPSVSAPWCAPTASGEASAPSSFMLAPGIGTPGAGRLYTLQRQSDGRLTDLQVLYESNPGDGPDGFAMAQSGTVYLNFFLANQIAVIAPDGVERARIGVMTTGLNGSEIPFDAPASSAFDGDRLFVTNHSVNVRNPLSFAVLDVFAGEQGLPLFYPSIGGTSTEDDPC